MEQIFALFDAMQRDSEDQIDKLMNDSDTELMAPEEIGQLTPGANQISLTKGTHTLKNFKKTR